MRSVVVGVLAVIGLMSGAGAARAADPAVFVVQYVDVAPALAARAAAGLREVRALGRQEPGNLSFETFAEAGRPSRFVILSVWRDQAAAEAHGSSPGATQLRDALEPLRITPVDQRALALLAGDPPGGGVGRATPGRGAVFVVTHMDSIPPFKDEAAAALQRLSIASQVQPGVLRYQVLQQSNRPNHFKLIEIWRDQKAFDAHIAAPATKQFREFVQQGAGSPYDERLYKALD